MNITGWAAAIHDADAFCDEKAV